MSRQRAAASWWVALLGVSLACSGVSSLAPVANPDPDVACPGRWQSWRLEITDMRADRRDAETVQRLLTDSLTRSFPGCHWESAGKEVATIRIELHRFAVRQDGNLWEADAGWTVLALDPSGRKLTEFEPEAHVSRPNYRGSNNELEAMKGAFSQAFERTLAGLRALS